METSKLIVQYVNRERVVSQLNNLIIMNKIKQIVTPSSPESTVYSWKSQFE